MNSGLSDISKSGKQSTAAMPVNCLIIGSDDKLDLFCWVLNGSKAPFSVMIGEHQTVDRLKKVIKKDMEPELDHWAASSITLWMVSTFLLACADEDI